MSKVSDYPIALAITEKKSGDGEDGKGASTTKHNNHMIFEIIMGFSVGIIGVYCKFNTV